MTAKLLGIVTVLAAPGVVMGLAWGWKSGAVYAFFLAVALLVVLATRVGGDWLESASRGRFRDGGRS